MRNFHALVYVIILLHRDKINLYNITKIKENMYLYIVIVL